MAIVWFVSARRALIAQVDYIAQHDRTAAEPQGLLVYEAVRLLSDFPNAGRPGRIEDTRELVVSGTPFVIAYRVRRSEVVILNVLHGAQKWPVRF